ncbi:hypothetical protein F4818DRAFT_399670 [Hypoxylon cercidicola]|nr:hypothetical protein F4818DRAFT_399670 [Hypoxylon cercidicola]
MWRWSARADDIIYIVTKNPELSGVLVIGSQRLQAALLIDPASESPLTMEEQAVLIEVFCLNRGEDGGRAVQLKSFAAAGLETTGLDNGERVTFIKADLPQPLLGLDNPTFDLLGAQIGLVIHAAWLFNFNLALSSFRPQLAGLLNLLTLTGSASARFVFISSIAAVEGNTSGPAPEEVLDNLDTPAAFGYGRAKFVAELLVDAAAQHLGSNLPATIIRAGQVAGPVQRRGAMEP